MAVFSVPESALGQFPVWCACAHYMRKKRIWKGEMKSIEEQREIGRKRWAGFKEPTVVKEPSSSFHLDTHKYKAQSFELPKRVSSFYLFSLFLRFSFSPCRFISDLLRSLPCWQSKFISCSCLFWTFHNIWPCFGIQHRSWWAPVTRRYGFEPSVMDGSLSSPLRIAASTFNFPILLSSI